jgi:hypothetical protein
VSCHVSSPQGFGSVELDDWASQLTDYLGQVVPHDYKETFPGCAFFEESERRFSGWSCLYSWFVSIAAGTRLRFPGFFVEPYELGVAADWRTSYAAAGVPQAVADHVDRNILVPYAWADRLANYYAGLWRSAFVFRYFFGSLAILAPLLSLTYGLALQTLMVFIIVGITVLSVRQKWQDKWVDYRFLAELLREVRFLMPLGCVVALPAPVYRVHDYASWVSWYHWLLSRNAGLPNYRMDVEFLQIYEKFLTSEVRSEAEYHERRGGELRRASLRLERASLFSFVGGLVIAAIGIVSSWPLIAPLAALTSALGSVFAGVRSQGEFVQQAMRYGDMAATLNRILDVLGRIQPTSQMLGKIAVDVADQMIDENFDWRVVQKHTSLTIW